ncbi:MAG TPA: hypothetical protein VLA43_01320 [Longimicrobiales bacterium]|nr:hypothetical protein [Longimicrobiales bacterium]
MPRPEWCAGDYPPVGGLYVSNGNWPYCTVDRPVSALCGDDVDCTPLAELDASWVQEPCVTEVGEVLTRAFPYSPPVTDTLPESHEVRYFRQDGALRAQHWTGYDDARCCQGLTVHVVWYGPGTPIECAN